MDAAGIEAVGGDAAGGGAAPRCPRCTGALAPAPAGAGFEVAPVGRRWACWEHGEVVPVQAPSIAGADVIADLAATSQVPLWLPWPLPPGWSVSGVQHAGDVGAGAVATALTCSGPDPLAFPADPGTAPVDAQAELVLIAELPGTGWGAAVAGLPHLDPGPPVGRPDAKVRAAGRPTPLWHVPAGPGPAVYAGEADGVWLYVIAWPTGAGALLLDEPELVDLRDPEHSLPIPYAPRA